MRPYSHLRAVVERLDTPDTTQADVRAVLEELHVTPVEFMELDSHPGRWGYGEHGWHSKIRQFRNWGGWSQWLKEVHPV